MFFSFLFKIVWPVSCEDYQLVTSLNNYCTSCNRFFVRRQNNFFILSQRFFNKTILVRMCSEYTKIWMLVTARDEFGKGQCDLSATVQMLACFDRGERKQEKCVFTVIFSFIFLRVLNKKALQEVHFLFCVDEYFCL